MPRHTPQEKPIGPKEVNLRQFWHIDVIIELDNTFSRLIVKKPSGQVTVPITADDYVHLR